MDIKIPATFRPSTAATVAIFVAAILFVNLGLWQTRRADVKLDLEQRFKQAGTQSLATAVREQNRFASIQVQGRFDADRHLLLDNKMLRGQAGVHVFTPFHSSDGLTILVNRGWLPLPYDRQLLPMVPTPDELIELDGILNIYPQPGRVLGPADQLNDDHWPQLVTYLNQADSSVALGVPLSPWVIQLSDDARYGFKGRNWKPVFMTSDKHKAYAFQWYALAVICMVLWGFSGTRRAKEINKKANEK